MKKHLAKFTIFELVFIAGCAALGIAIKPILTPLVHLITGPLFIPGGSVGGGLYMMFIVVAALVVPKMGSATLATIVQAILAITTGVIGSHGLLSLFTYILPGIMMDVVFALFRYQNKHALIPFLMGAFANSSGTFASNLVFFRLPWIPLLLSLSAGFLFGGLGGLLADRVSVGLKRFL
jgi:ABC-type thiamin/hydroxymethylpyrimidine transport system permease subunit